MKSDTKSAIIMALWQYIKQHRLQDSTDHRVIHADAGLKQVFGVADKFLFTQLPELMTANLSPEEPIVIDYEIHVDSDKHVWEFVMDIDVDVDDPIRAPMMKFISTPGHQKEISTFDQLIVHHVSQLHNHRLKRDFMQAFSNDPVTFVNEWIASQARDLNIVLGENTVNLETQRRGDFYHEPWVPEAVFSYLASKVNWVCFFLSF